MHIWTDLAVREAAMLALLLLMGAGPASLLSSRFDAGSRIAMAPVLGFCLGTCVTTTLLQFAATNDTYWVLIPLAVGSSAFAAVRTLRATDTLTWRRRLPISDIVALVVVGVVVAGPISYTLHERHTVGPAVYYYTDVDNYVAVQDAARTVDLHVARDHWKGRFAEGARYGNLTQYVWSYIAQVGSNLDATPLDSNVNALLGLWANDTYAPFLTVLLLAGALGAFAAVRYYTRSRTWAACLAGCLFGGPMFLELWFDSYQAAIVAIGIVIPVLLLFDDALRTPRWASYGLIAILLGAMLSVYPLYMALILAAGALMVAARALARRRARERLAPVVRPLVLGLVAIAVMTIAFDAVAFLRDVRYYREVLNGQIGLPRVGYTLPLSVLPGWIAQTREFWNMPPLGSAGAKQLLLGGLLPLIFLAVAVLGVRRYRSAAALVGLAGICAVVAEYSYLSQSSCTYCAERNLLPLTPIAAVLIALGLTALFIASPRWMKVAAVLGAVLVVVAVGQRTRVELTRFANGSYFLESANRSVLSHAPATGSIEEEGYGASVFAQAEQPLIYHLINAKRPGRVSIILGSDLANAIQYLDFGPVRLPPSPTFDPSYRLVLTRLAGIATDRRVLARSGGIALEERRSPLDITPYAGLGAAFERLDPTGAAWVQPEYPLQLLIAGSSGGRALWGRLTFKATVPIAVPAQRGVRTRQAGSVLTACVRATGTDPIHFVTFHIKADALPGQPPSGLFPPAMPLEGLQLTAMSAVAGSCTP
jgi:hypothetical protein